MTGWRREGVDCPASWEALDSLSHDGWTYFLVAKGDGNYLLVSSSRTQYTTQEYSEIEWFELLAECGRDASGRDRNSGRNER